MSDPVQGDDNTERGISGTDRAALEALLRRLNPTWGDLAWRYTVHILQIVVTYTIIGAALRLGWSLLG